MTTRRVYREAIEQFYAANPAASQAQCRKATGAPQDTVGYVYGLLTSRGLLQRRAVFKAPVWDSL